MRALLSQHDDQAHERVIVYASKRLLKRMRQKSAATMELFAIFTFCRQFKHYYMAIKGQNVDRMVARWHEELQQYDFEIQHRAGKAHGNADALSRRPDHAQEVNAIFLNEPTKYRWQPSQNADPDTAIIYNRLTNNSRRPSRAETTAMGPRRNGFGKNGPT